MRKTNEGIGALLLAFDANVNANGGQLALKYDLSASDLDRVHQATLVWSWFQDALKAARDWSQSLTQTRDLMKTSVRGDALPLPGVPVLPPVPTLVGPPVAPAQLESGFFVFFNGLAAGIKAAENYDIADGILLSIEGAEILPPIASETVPVVTGAIVTSGHPELNCPKAQFQGYQVSLTLPNQPKKIIGTSLTRRYSVAEPLPAPGTAEVWTFEVQYLFQNKLFGHASQPLVMTVRG